MSVAEYQRLLPYGGILRGRPTQALSTVTVLHTQWVLTVQHIWQTIFFMRLLLFCYIFDWPQRFICPSIRVASLFITCQQYPHKIRSVHRNHDMETLTGMSANTIRDICSPSHDDEEVQPVPGVPQVTATAKDPKRHHLYHHLQRKEDVDECIEGLRGDKRR